MEGKKPKVAYFCMEFGLHEDLRIYAGGLGILAGDILKAARELDVPMVGVGILWRQGYTRQLIGEDGRPYDSYPTNDYIYDLVEDTGVKVKVKVRDDDIYCKVWKVDRYDNVPLYLLDTNLPENKNKWITGQLYGWFEEERIAQEIVLGIGGVRALRKLGIDVDLYHFNDGHPVLAGTELINEKMAKGMSFDEALEETRKEVIFTTHTPVKEGNESHGLEVMKYMGAFNGLTLDQMIKIGDSPFNMTVAGLRLSRIANGVSELHGKTARKMWSYVDNKAPIVSITNGVHRKSWVDDRIVKAYENGEDLLKPHQEIKSELIDFVEEKTGTRLNPEALLIGFARRAAPYKRGNLIFRKPEVIRPYLEEGKIQIIFSGKAHPLDDVGKGIIADLVKMSEKYPNSVVFLEDYNIEIGRMLTRGVDVWLNNPRRPLEASGTSGMKAAMNGALNLSTLDGWWPEACEHGVNGWQLGDGYEGEDQDQHDLDALYNVLLKEVVPTYYDNKEKWAQMMRASIESTYDKFSAQRMVSRYYDEMYQN
ncbi:alpha-glucan family phosphorylase [Halothermothrix orenii]|uniref:glycogen phosphorylase n=1 Tax=Halothermothrix orenii (strain H 168 / OCM 544 / DSM 9562) TaxID=373903 RepID=B8D0F7_HALOH|nr:alpha-glucan family phosphorylase [Halothermothrix orenii]ACL70893.1 Alpha-glucan phosphorylase [Halothermothrix orenii H 168]